MLIIGTGGFASDLLVTLSHEMDPSEIVLFNDQDDLEDIIYHDTYRIITNKAGAKEYFKNEDARFIVGLGEGPLRERIAQEFMALGGKNPSYISKLAYVSPKAQIAEVGVIIMHFASVSATARIEEGSIIYLNSGVGHHSEIGRYCLISASVFMSMVKLGDYSVIGIGASLKPGISLGNNSIVGTGAVVTRSFGNNAIIFGNPAREK